MSNESVVSILFFARQCTMVYSLNWTKRIKRFGGKKFCLDIFFFIEKLVPRALLTCAVTKCKARIHRLFKELLVFKFVFPILLCFPSMYSRVAPPDESLDATNESKFNSKTGSSDDVEGLKEDGHVPHEKPTRVSAEKWQVHRLNVFALWSFGKEKEKHTCMAFVQKVVFK